MDSLPCLDYSFYNLVEISDLVLEEPRVDEKAAAKGGQKSVTPTRNEDGKFHSIGILKLNNNNLQDLQGKPETGGNLFSLLGNILQTPISLTWLDLSFNAISKIDQVLCQLENLKILLFHGNGVTDIREVDKLAALEHLKKLSLHGNPIEQVKNYKCYVLCRLVNLNNFDMATVTKNDRKNMEIVSNLQPMKQNRKKKTEE